MFLFAVETTKIVVTRLALNLIHLLTHLLSEQSNFLCCSLYTQYLIRIITD